MRRMLIAVLFVLFAPGVPPATAEQTAGGRTGHYRNFRVAIYVVVDSTQRLADPAVFERELGRVMSQVRFDKVYLEVYRNRRFASDAEIETVKRAFESRGIEV